MPITPRSGIKTGCAKVILGFGAENSDLHPMDIEQYKSDSERTLIDKGHEMNLLHAAMGIGTEAGELLDAFKRQLFYGKPLDVVNIKEEVGDLMWYVAILLRELDLDFQEILDLNIQKLRARFPDKFTEDHALNRDLETERAILEQRDQMSHS